MCVIAALHFGPMIILQRNLQQKNARKCAKPLGLIFESYFKQIQLN